MTPIEMLRHQALTRPKDAAFFSGDEIWTYERLAFEADSLARGLVSRGIKQGDRVVLHMANRPEMIVAYYACFQIGAVVAPMRTALKTTELTSLLLRLQPSLYIGEAELYEQIAEVDPTILAPGKRFIVNGAVAAGGPQPWASLFGTAKSELLIDPERHASAVLITTSGTTAEPKLVIHTHSTLSETAKLLKHRELDKQRSAMGFAPLAHASGLFLLLGCVQFGVALILIERFDPAIVLDAIARHRCTFLSGMPYVFAALLEVQQSNPREVSSLRSCSSAGDICSPALQNKFRSVFDRPLRSFWASTEASGNLTFGSEPGLAGRIVDDSQVRLVDTNEVPVKQGEAGELQLRAPNVSIGYWAGPCAIEGIPKDGWFSTGDLMRQDAKGELWFVSRIKDLIIRSGTNISPVEIERVLLAAHPAIKDAAVVGVPDEVLGQRVSAFVQLANRKEGIKPEDILAAVRTQLADYKIPETLTIVDQIPRNALGKIDRKTLLEVLRLSKGGY